MNDYFDSITRVKYNLGDAIYYYKNGKFGFTACGYILARRVTSRNHFSFDFIYDVLELSEKCKMKYCLEEKFILKKYKI